MFSIVLPVVKIRYFEEALRSVLDQDYRDFELIVVDNQAEEGLQAILDRNQDDRMRVICHRSRVPIIENWNLCLSYASRRYFVLFSDDDIMRPRYLQAVVDTIGRHPSMRMLHSRVRVFTDVQELRDLSPIAPEVEDGINYVYETLCNGRMQLISDFVWDRQFFVEQGGYVSLEGAWASDEATTYKIAIAAGKVYYISEPMVLWRHSIENFTYNMNYKNHYLANNHFISWMEDFLEKVPEHCRLTDQFALIKKSLPAIYQNRMGNCMQNLGMAKSFLSPLFFKISKDVKSNEIEWTTVFRSICAVLFKRLTGVKHYRG